MDTKYNFILASSSPRRKELLSTYIDKLTILPACIDEYFPNNIAKEQAPLYIAKLKANAVKTNITNNDIVISADTIVLLDNTIYGKPIDKQDAFNMLSNLSGKEHTVITGVCCYSGDKHICIEFTDITYVKFIEIEKNIIYEYLNKNEYIDKAGAYAIQGYASIFIEYIKGNYDNVVGLPVGRLMRELFKYNINIFQI